MLDLRLRRLRGLHRPAPAPAPAPRRASAGPHATVHEGLLQPDGPRFAVNRGSSHSHCLICSRHGSRVPGRGGDTRTGGVGRPMARRTGVEGVDFDQARELVGL